MYLDNFNTSVPLLGRLRDNLKIGGYVTARSSSALFPLNLRFQSPMLESMIIMHLRLQVIKHSVFHKEVGAPLWFANVPVTIKHCS